MKVEKYYCDICNEEVTNFNIIKLNMDTYDICKKCEIEIEKEVIKLKNKYDDIIF